MWNYRAHCYRVVDGDTYDVAVDLGFNIYHKIRLRLKGVDTPEVFGANASEEGKTVSEYVRGMLENKDCVITTYKIQPSTFNRYEADVMVLVDGVPVDIAVHLVEKGYAAKV